MQGRNLAALACVILGAYVEGLRWLPMPPAAPVPNVVRDAYSHGLPVIHALALALLLAAVICAVRRTYVAVALVSGVLLSLMEVGADVEHRIIVAWLGDAPHSCTPPLLGYRLVNACELEGREARLRYDGARWHIDTHQPMPLFASQSIPTP